MGSSKPVAETKKRKKKGRPSLLDLQKRSLRVQKLEQEKTIQNHSHRQNPNPSSAPNPGLRSRPSSVAPLRRSARRNPAAAEDDEDDDDDEDEEEEERDEDEGSACRRKAKKLRLVLRLPHNGKQDHDSSGSDSDARRKRRIDNAGDEVKTERQDSNLKATDLTQELSETGPTTPLPVKKLLEFILDRLQKKDTYGVFSEPVDPEELPDYYDIIEHPMDFATIRKKLTDGAYENLEQFEKDVFLISSNAMQYNSPDTIYYRQARQIQELAKKNFENLRQQSDDDEAEPKQPRRGRPPMKSIFKKVGRPPVEHTGSDFSSSATLSNVINRWPQDLSQKGLDEPISDMSRPYSHRNIQATNWKGVLKSERNDNPGSSLKGVAAKYGKKLSVADENRRSTFNQSYDSSSHEPSVLTVLDGERKQLVPVGLLMEHAYARSLARFAANLGPIGWEIAAKRIERVLSPGTKFGRGWVGDNDMPRPSQLIQSSTTHSAKPEPTVPSNGEGSVTEQHSNNSVHEVVGADTNLSSPATSTSITHSGTVGPVVHMEIMAGDENGLKPQSLGNVHRTPPKTPLQMRQNLTIQPTLNGFNHQLLNPQCQGSKVMPSKPPGNSSAEAMSTDSGALQLASRAGNYYHQSSTGHFSAEKATPATDPSVSSSSNNQSHDSARDRHGTWHSLSSNPKPGPVPPDLNVGLQSPGSPPSGLLVDSQHSNLALQL